MQETQDHNIFDMLDKVDWRGQNRKGSKGVGLAWLGQD